MKHLFSVLVLSLFCFAGYSQITITSADMPVSGDTLRFSNATPGAITINPGDSCANFNWNYPFTPISQGVDTYKTAVQVNVLYALTVGLTAFGYKVADSLPGLGGVLPISVKSIYTFFEEANSPSRFEAYAFAANISGLPAAFLYTEPDKWYIFPLNYQNYDSSHYVLNISLDTIASIKEIGYRKTRVDGWGTITTPYYTTPVNCIRVRSQIHEIDTISFNSFKFGVPRNTVEYKWLANGQHFPCLWVTSNVVGGNEVITSIQYRDSARALDTNVTNAVSNVNNIITNIKSYPNPTQNGLTTFDIPADWHSFTIEVFDVQGKEMAVFNNKRNIDIQSLPAGQYIARIISGKDVAYVQVTR